MKRITGHLAEKNGKWYAVINLYDADGKRKEKWQYLDLESTKGGKREAEYRLHQLLDKYNSDDLYLQHNMSHAERERSRIANMQVIEYLPEWLESHKSNVAVLTYTGYKTMIESRMVGELIKPDYVTDHFKIFLKANGLKVIRFHDLRHSCASLLLANGVPMKMIQDWLGHSDMGTTVNINNPHKIKQKSKQSEMYDKSLPMIPICR